jgi:hypothetical protein
VCPREYDFYSIFLLLMKNWTWLRDMKVDCSSLNSVSNSTCLNVILIRSDYYHQTLCHTQLYVFTITRHCATRRFTYLLKKHCATYRLTSVLSHDLCTHSFKSSLSQDTVTHTASRLYYHKTPWHKLFHIFTITRHCATHSFTSFLLKDTMLHTTSRPYHTYKCWS